MGGRGQTWDPGEEVRDAGTPQGGKETWEREKKGSQTRKKESSKERDKQCFSQDRLQVATAKMIRTNKNYGSLDS